MVLELLHLGSPRLNDVTDCNVTSCSDEHSPIIVKRFATLVSLWFHLTTL